MSTIVEKTKHAGCSYNNDDLSGAIRAVKSGEMSQRCASKYFGVPRTTLATKLRTGDEVIKQRGVKRVLEDAEEEQICKWLKTSAERNRPQPLIAVREGASAILNAFPRKNSFTNNFPSAKWQRNFLKRQPGLTHRRPEALPPASSCVTLENIVGWWLDTDELFKKNGFLEILKDPSRILNADETGFIFNPKPKRVIQETGAKESYIAETSGSKVSVTVMCTVR